MDDTGDDDRIHQGQSEHSTFDGEDIYAEDGSIRSDFLMHVGAAIADRDLLFLRRHVARLHESEMGDLLEAIPRANIPAGIEVVARSPASTEVRFFHAGDRDLVFRAAAALETRLRTPVQIRYLPQFSAVAPGQMEVWLAAADQAPRALPPPPSLDLRGQ